jgi:hypothetical protein
MVLLALPVYVFVAGSLGASFQLMSSFTKTVTGAVLATREIKIMKQERDFKVGINRPVVHKKQEIMARRGLVLREEKVELVTIEEPGPLQGTFLWTEREITLAYTAMTYYKDGKASGIDMLALRIIGENRLKDPILRLQLQKMQGHDA